MKRLFAAFMLVVLVALGGCAKKQVQPAAPVPPVPQQGAAEQPVAFVRELVLPERDPFQVADLSSPGTVKGAPAEVKGRDPFAPVANVLEVPVEPVEEPPVVIPPDDKPVITPGKVAVQVHTQDICWLDVYVDNERVLRANVPAGEVLNFEAEAEVRFEQVGRERALVLVVNGYNAGRLAAMVPDLQKGPVTLTDVGIRVSLDQRYSGGVLVGVRFRGLGD